MSESLQIPRLNKGLTGHFAQKLEVGEIMRYTVKFSVVGMHSFIFDDRVDKIF